MKSSIYPKIAEAVRENTIAGLDNDYIYKPKLIKSLADILEAGNKNFNRKKFLEYCE